MRVQRGEHDAVRCVLLDGMEGSGKLIRDGDPESPRAGWDSVVPLLCADELKLNGAESGHDGFELFPYLLSSRVVCDESWIHLRNQLHGACDCIHRALLGQGQMSTGEQ